jgi:6-phosphofructokinase 1
MNGNLIVGQSGGPTAVINSSLVGVFKAAKERGIGKIYGMLHGVEGLLRDEYIDLKEHIHDELDIELLKRTPSSFLGSCRYKLPNPAENEAIYQQLFAILAKLDIKYFLYIGGNDSMDTIQKMSDYARVKNIDICFMGVPKTIDNDLAVTDHTPGFGSAAKLVGTIFKEVIRDGHVYGNKNVTIVEIMGRNAGWLTASSALSRMEDCMGPDLIFVPEVAFDIDSFLTKVERVHSEKKSVVIAVSEGLKLPDGRYVCEDSDNVMFTDNFGHKSLSGTSRYLANKIAREIGCKTRAIEFSTIQRCASHTVSRTDITEAFLAGGHSAQAAMDGHTAEMVIFDRISNDPYHITTRTCDIKLIANIEKKLPLEWLTPDKTFVTKEFLTYCRPLIQAELTPIMVDGLPRHLFASFNRND